MAAGSRKGFGCLALFALPFALAGAGLVAVAAHSLVLYRDSADWARVDARIEAVALEESTDADSDATRLDVTYSYAFHGVTHQGKRAGTATGFSSDPIHAERAAALEQARQAGTAVPALVNPREPGEALLYRELRPTTVALLSVGLLFALTGLLLFVLALRWRRTENWRRVQERLFPGQPWRHERVWDGFVVASAAGTNLFAIWAVTIFVGLFAAPFALLLGDGQSGDNGRIAAFALAGGFVLVLVFALRATISRLRHGTATLALAETPLRPGGVVHALVRWGPDTAPRPADCTLRCVQRWTERRYQNQRRTESREVFSVRTKVDASAWTRRPEGFGMPVTLALPADAMPRNEGDPSTSWLLEVSLAGPGVGARHVFDLPVFEATDEAVERHAVALF